MLIRIIAEELWITDLNEDADLSPALISFWLREHIGDLNSLAATSFSINPDNSEILPDPSEDEKSILKQLYLIHFYSVKLRSTLAAANSDSVLEISEAGGTIRLLNKNELAKTYIAIKKEEEGRLKNLLHGYRMNRSEATQVTGKDTISENYNG